jgi:predicted regulator of Ras-like GTPase activity (Roadblock/LC7/MglB family)
VTLMIWAWLLSVVGALLFFAAGATWIRQRTVRAATRTDAARRPADINSDALQSIVEAEVRTRGAKSAVITDEMGLVVAASVAGSEHGDALAAFGAYLAEVGTKARRVLPLHEVRQVIVRDDRNVTLIVRPLDSADHSLALVTLAEPTEREGAPKPSPEPR